MTALSGDILLFRSSGPTDPPAPAAAEKLNVPVPSAGNSPLFRSCGPTDPPAPEAAEKLNVPLPPRQPEEVTYA